MTPDEAIEAGDLVEAEAGYLHQFAREAYAAAHADGYRAGYRQADPDRSAADGPADLAGWLPNLTAEI